MLLDISQRLTTNPASGFSHSRKKNCSLNELLQVGLILPTINTSHSPPAPPCPFQSHGKFHGTETESSKTFNADDALNFHERCSAPKINQCHMFNRELLKPKLVLLVPTPVKQHSLQVAKCQTTSVKIVWRNHANGFWKVVVNYCLGTVLNCCPDFAFWVTVDKPSKDANS